MAKTQKHRAAGPPAHTPEREKAAPPNGGRTRAEHALAGALKDLPSWAPFVGLGVAGLGAYWLLGGFGGGGGSVAAGTGTAGATGSGAATGQGAGTDTAVMNAIAGVSKQNAYLARELRGLAARTGGPAPVRHAHPGGSGSRVHRPPASAAAHSQPSRERRGQTARSAGEPLVRSHVSTTGELVMHHFRQFERQFATAGTSTAFDRHVATGGRRAPAVQRSGRTRPVAVSSGAVPAAASTANRRAVAVQREATGRYLFVPGLRRAAVVQSAEHRPVDRHARATPVVRIPVRRRIWGGGHLL